MKIDNPFETGHIKNYLLLYASVVVIMILFFIAATLFIENDKIEKKVFPTKAEKSVASEKSVNVKSDEKQVEKKEEPASESKFKLMQKGY